MTSSPASDIGDTEKDNSNTLVLFIHGLGGNPQQTWRNKSSPGLDDLVEEELGIECKHFSYPTSFYRVPFLSKKISNIQSLAAGLRTEIKYSYDQFDNIVLVCHSLGGLVARWYIYEQELSEMPHNVKHLILFATPNTGTSLGNIGNMLSWWRHPQLKQLTKNSDILETLNKQWISKNISSKVNTTYILAEQDRVVDERSAQLYPGNPNVETILNCDHRNIVKPDGVGDLSFKIVSKIVLSYKKSASVVKKDSEKANKLLNISRKAYSECKFDKSFGYIKDAYNHDSSNPEIWRQYIRVCTAKNDNSGARNFVQKIKENSNSEKILVHEAEIYIREEKYKKAIEVLDSVTNREIYNAEYYHGVANMFLYKSTRDPLNLIFARDHLRRAALVHYPDHWWAKTNLYLANILIDRLDLSEQDFGIGEQNKDYHIPIDEIIKDLNLAIKKEPLLLSAKMYRLLCEAIRNDYDRFSEIANSWLTESHYQIPSIPKNFPYSWIYRIELLFAEEPERLALFKNGFINWLAKYGRNG